VWWAVALTPSADNEIGDAGCGRAAGLLDSNPALMYLSLEGANTDGGVFAALIVVA